MSEKISQPFRSIAVTGGNGQLGQAVVKELSDSAEVTSLDLTPGRPGVVSRYTDITSLESLRYALKGFEAVVHIAALLQPEDPDDRMFEVNVTGTWNVLQAASELGIRKIVIISSETASGIINITRVPLAVPEYLPIDEAHPLRPVETYGMSKQLCEVMAQSFARRDHMEIVVLRPTLILFPGWEEYVLRTRTADDPDLWSYVVVWDVARAVRLALRPRGTAYSVFYLSARDTFSPEPTLDFMRRRFGPIEDIRRPELFRRNPHASIWDLINAEQQLGFRPEYDWRRFLRESDAGRTKAVEHGG
jgi:nucleoside-diphosphate-sugar epimerase